MTTVLLRGIDAFKVFEDFENNKYKRKLPILGKITIHDKKGRGNLINQDYISGKDGQKMFLVSSDACQAKKICRNCLCDYKEESVGIPTKIDLKYEVEEGRHYSCYYVSVNRKVFCSESCCLYYCIERNMSDEISNLNFLFKSRTGLDLIPCKDPFLLIHNGGTESIEEWSSPKVNYIKALRFKTYTNETPYIKIVDK